MLIYGRNVAYEALTKKQKIKKAYIAEGFSERDIMFGITSNHIPYKVLERRRMDKMVDGVHQGIIFEVEDYKYATLDDIIKEDALIVILDHIEDPHNFGAIIRTCEAAGVNGIIIPKDRSASVNGTVIKTSVGAINNMQIVEVTNLVNTIKDLKEEGFWIVGTDMEGTPYTDIDYKGKTAIVIGNEGSGMSRLVSENCDFIATIPMIGKINSLNASVAAGIVIFEAVNLRK